MPLYNISGAQYLGLVEFFNSHQRKDLLGKLELRAILSRRDINPTNNELQQMIDAISVESSGINFQAFVDYVSENPALRDQEKDYSAAFSIFDTKGTGELTRDDLAVVIGKMSMKGSAQNAADVDAILKACDKNNDNKIQFDEFIEVMKKQI